MITARPRVREEFVEMRRLVALKSDGNGSSAALLARNITPFQLHVLLRLACKPSLTTLANGPAPEGWRTPGRGATCRCGRVAAPNSRALVAF
jgi:hypothetical protein